MSDITLFMAGDYEAQKLCLCRSKSDIQKMINKHFAYSYLISDDVIIPSGCYIESDYTTMLIDNNHRLLLPNENSGPNAGLAIAEDRDSFSEDVRVKASWFPKTYAISDPEKTSTLLARLEDVEPLKRSGKMRKVLTECILEDISPGGNAFQKIKNDSYSDDETMELVRPLNIVVTEQKYAMLPPYIQIVIEGQKNSNVNIQKRWLDFVLFKNYVISCEKAYKAYCNNPLSIWYPETFKLLYSFHVDYRDTLLFDGFVKSFPLKELENIENMPPQKLLIVKHSRRFNTYLESYKRAVELIKKELELYVFKQNYSIVGSEFEEEFKREKEIYERRVLVDSTRDAEILYRILNRLFPLSKRKEFQKYLSNQKLDLPMINVMGIIEDKQNGLLSSFIKELYYLTRKQHKGERAVTGNIIYSLISIGNKQTTNNIGTNSNLEKNTDAKNDNTTMKPSENEQKTKSESATKEGDYRFKVALSFPGEHRKLIEAVANILSNHFGKKHVLYDKYYEAEFARPDLDLYLQNLYSKRSELIVVFVCSNYDEKIWCGVEWRAIRRVLNDKNSKDRIMFVKLDAGEVEGMSGIVDGSFDATNATPERIANAIIERYSLNQIK